MESTAMETIKEGWRLSAEKRRAVESMQGLMDRMAAMEAELSLKMSRAVENQRNALGSLSRAARNQRSRKAFALAREYKILADGLENYARKIKP